MLNQNRENKKLALIIAQAVQDQQFVKINVYNETGDQETVGLITLIDQENRRLKLSHERGVDWLPFDDILNVELVTQ